MATYQISFVGREVGSIGATHGITANVQADNEDAAHLELYKKWEHIMVDQIRLIDDTPKQEYTHYGLTREEFASKVGKHYSGFDNRLRPLCSNGSYHARTTRSKVHVDCPVCLAHLNK